MDFDVGSMGDIPTRPMRVKVLYTFDQENKNNCLTRFPDAVEVPVVALEDGAQVGVLDLTHCIQAITTSSPELVSCLPDGDFAIYAYDYSENETPLVGQGMLSSALLQGTQDWQSKKMVTGRVCKNVMALFNNGVKETLEVKLRLVPVSKPAQYVALGGSSSFRTTLPATSAGFDPNVWNVSRQQNRAQRPMDDYFNFDAMSSRYGHGMSMSDNYFDLQPTENSSGGGQEVAGSVGAPQTLTGGISGFDPASAAQSYSAPGSRAVTPMMDSQSSTSKEPLRHQSFSGNIASFDAIQSRPQSRASARNEIPDAKREYHASTSSSSSQAGQQQQSALQCNEDQQARKRAKVTQAEWRGRSSFGSKSADLRINAATTASLQMHRPVAKRAAAPGSDLEPPPRAPTPVPQRSLGPPQLQQHQSLGRRSLLRQASTADSEGLSDIETFSDAIVSSPDDGSPERTITAEGTPQDIPSSPPIFPSMHKAQPSSPGLPTLSTAHMVDSGYMSEQGLYSSNAAYNPENEEDRSPDAQDYEVATQYRSRRYQPRPVIKTERSASVTSRAGLVGAPQAEININLEQPGDMSQLQSRMSLDFVPHSRRSIQGSVSAAQPPQVKKARKTRKSAVTSTEQQSRSEPVDSATIALSDAAEAPHVASEPANAPTSRCSSLALPPRWSSIAPDALEPNAYQKPSTRKRQALQRSYTTANTSEAGSPAPSDNEGRPRGTRRSGGAAQRRKTIEQRMHRSISEGLMPEFCSHCGCIETPTWRRVYSMECTGKPSPLDYAEGEGETIGVEITETDPETGEATKFVVRKSMRKTKDSKPGEGFVEHVVCNPCGLWFNKSRAMRPPEKWTKSSVSHRSKSGRSNEPGVSTDGLEPPSDALFTDQAEPEYAMNEQGRTGGALSAHAAREGQQSRSQRPRASSMQVLQLKRGSGPAAWTASQLNSALTRAVQSSPGQDQGSQHSPIEVEDLTPQPTRRVLFPSPRREGEVKSLDDNGQVSLKSTVAPANAVEDLSTARFKPGLDINIQQTDTTAFDAFTFDKENMVPDLSLDDGDFSYLFNGSPINFKTPHKTPARASLQSTPSRILRSAMKTPVSASRKRQPHEQVGNCAKNPEYNFDDFLVSPSSNRYFLRSTPSRLERTPGRQSQNSGGNDVSPWSRHLAQMLSDANETTTLTSPSRQFDFSDLPTFTTPGRAHKPSDWAEIDGIMDSDLANFNQVDREGSKAPDGAGSGNSS